MSDDNFTLKVYRLITSIGLPGIKDDVVDLAEALRTAGYRVEIIDNRTQVDNFPNN